MAVSAAVRAAQARQKAAAGASYGKSKAQIQASKRTSPKVTTAAVAKQKAVAATIAARGAARVGASTAAKIVAERAASKAAGGPAISPTYTALKASGTLAPLAAAPVRQAEIRAALPSFLNLKPASPPPESLQVVEKQMHPLAPLGVGEFVKEIPSAISQQVQSWLSPVPQMAPPQAAPAMVNAPGRQGGTLIPSSGGRGITGLFILPGGLYVV